LLLSVDALDCLLSSESLVVDSADALLQILFTFRHPPLLRHIRWAFVSQTAIASLCEDPALCHPTKSFWQAFSDWLAHPDRNIDSLIVRHLFEVCRAQSFNLGVAMVSAPLQRPRERSNSQVSISERSKQFMNSQSNRERKANRKSRLCNRFIDSHRAELELFESTHLRCPNQSDRLLYQLLESLNGSVAIVLILGGRSAHDCANPRPK
jgi:hypothetical protein